MILNKKLPVWVFIITVVASVIAIVIVAQQVNIALKDIRGIGVSIAEIGKDYCGAEKHRLIREGGFCGYSTNGQCNADNDCITGGCSGQVCQSKSEEPMITTCEYRDCYNAKDYNLTCGCKNNQCQWK